MAIYSGMVGAFYKESSTTHTFVSQACTLQADNRTVRINDTTKVNFKKDPSLFKVYKGGVELTTAYEICFDCVVFAEDLTAGVYTVDGTYSEMVQVGGSYEWSIDIKQAVQDCTEFGDTWQSNIKGLLSWSGSSKSHYLDEDYITVMENGEPLLFRFYVDNISHDSYVCYGHIDGHKGGTKIEGITDAEMSFSGDGRIYFTSI
jgi:hypothetical protein